MSFTYNSWRYFNPRSLAGATKLQKYLSVLTLIFQSTLPRGSDQQKYLELVGYVTFQSTLPRGSDLASSESFAAFFYFNPRSLAGATAKAAIIDCKRLISIHAPSRERLNLLICLPLFVLFQSTLPRGSD